MRDADDFEVGNKWFLMFSLIWPLFIFFVIGHIYCNYNAVKSVTMKTFNRNRFHILAQHYLRYNSQILDTNTVNKLEPVLSPCRRCFSRIRLGCSLNYFTSLEIRSGAEKFSREHFLIKFNMQSKILISLFLAHSQCII